MADDSCPECGYTVQSDWIACPICATSLTTGTDVDVTGDDDITVVSSEKVEIVHHPLDHHGADPQVVADLMKRVEALDTTPQLTPQTSDDSAEPELRMALAQGLLRDVLDGKLNREMIQGIPTLRVLCEQLYGSDYLEQD